MTHPTVSEILRYATVVFPSRWLSIRFLPHGSSLSIVNNNMLLLKSVKKIKLNFLKNETISFYAYVFWMCVWSHWCLRVFVCELTCWKQLRTLGSMLEPPKAATSPSCLGIWMASWSSRPSCLWSHVSPADATWLKRSEGVGQGEVEKRTKKRKRKKKQGVRGRVRACGWYLK